MRSLGSWGVSLVVGLLVLACPSLAQQSGLIVGGTGSGFIVSSDGYILTNEHVIRGANKITVYVGDRSYTATVVAVSEANDLALLKIPATGLTAVRLGNSLYVEVLEPVVAMGYPKAGYGRDLTSSTGEITAIRTNVPGREGKDTLQHNATITHGSSGGPLFNRRGEVIGVNFAGDPPLNFAIPINEAIPLLRSVPGFDLRSMGSATSPMTPSQIVAASRAAVVFIDCRQEIALVDLLPPLGSLSNIWYAVEDKQLVDWTEWLKAIGFPVLQGAGLRGRRDVNTMCNGFVGYENAIHVFLFATPDSALRASEALFRQTPWESRVTKAGKPLFSVVLSEGRTALSGISATYRIVATDWLDFTGRECTANMRGLFVFSLGPLVFRIELWWYAKRVALDIQGHLLCLHTYGVLPASSELFGGCIVEIGTDSRILGVCMCIETLANELQQLAELVATTALNRLR